MSVVSVIIPTFNRASKIAGAIESVLNQSCQKFEIIVVDDASTDCTEQMIESFANDRIRYIKTDRNVGGGAARNLGIDASMGEYVAFLDSDDEWTKDHLKDSISIIENSNVQGSISSFYVCNKERRTVFMCSPILPGTSMVNYILGSGGGDPRSSTMVFRRNAIHDIRFDSDLRKYQDWDLAIRFARKFRFAVKSVPGAILHVSDGDRMSASPNHDATQAFMSNYISEAKPASVARFYAALMKSSIGGNSDSYYKIYRLRAWKCFKHASPAVKMKIIILSIPFVYKTTYMIHSAFNILICNILRRKV